MNGRCKAARIGQIVSLPDFFPEHFWQAIYKLFSIKGIVIGKAKILTQVNYLSVRIEKMFLKEFTAVSMPKAEENQVNAGIYRTAKRQAAYTFQVRVCVPGVSHAERSTISGSATSPGHQPDRE